MRQSANLKLWMAARAKVNKIVSFNRITLPLGEVIPIRVYLGAYELTPSYKNINNKFSVKYFINLVLVDEEDRRYFKQQEITLWRRK